MVGLGLFSWRRGQLGRREQWQHWTNSVRDTTTTTCLVCCHGPQYTAYRSLAGTCLSILHRTSTVEIRSARFIAQRNPTVGTSHWRGETWASPILNGIRPGRQMSPLAHQHWPLFNLASDIVQPVYSPSGSRAAHVRCYCLGRARLLFPVGVAPSKISI